MQKAYFAGGCFWGVEYYFSKTQGVIETKVGYMGGEMENPTYEDVCSKKSGHAEIVEIIFDETKVQFEDLAKLFFEIHDPTQKNRQGPDIGTQYRSQIFFMNQSQKQTAEKLINILREKGFDVKTELSEAGKFWPAETYHQQYYEKNGKEPYCHFRRKIF